MPTYITVLNSSAGLQYWRAVQVANSLAAIKANRFYTAGINTNIPKSPDDVFVEGKTVTEALTGATAAAGVYKVAAAASRGLLLMSGTAPKSVIKKIPNKKNK